MNLDKKRTIQEKFRACLLGSTIGDVIGAVVEAESPAYISKTYRDINAILEEDILVEPFGENWKVGLFTDDTQMTLALVEWLIHDDSMDGKALLCRFSEKFQAWRRYGPGTQRILEMFPSYEEKWRSLAQMSFPHGSFGNGSAMRSSPIGLRYYNCFDKIALVAQVVGGDTDTIAFMTGALAGAFLGKNSIPETWLKVLCEKDYTVDVIKNLADHLFQVSIDEK